MARLGSKPQSDAGSIAHVPTGDMWPSRSPGPHFWLVWLVTSTREALSVGTGVSGGKEGGGEEEKHCQEWKQEIRNNRMSACLPSHLHGEGDRGRGGWRGERRTPDPTRRGYPGPVTNGT